MTIHWFSPLPPARTDIGHYSARLLPALAEHDEVILWHQQDEVDSGLAYYAQLCRWHDLNDLDWPALNGSDRVYLHLGNNARFHAGIWQVARHHPATVVLHDGCLTHFFLGLFLEQHNDNLALRKACRRWHGQAGLAQLDAFLCGESDDLTLAQQCPLTPLAISAARHVIVHSQLSGEMAAPYAPSWAHLPLPYTSQVHTPAVRSLIPPWRLIAFGHIGGNRGLDTVLRVLAKWSEPFIFDIFGYIDQPQPMQHLIKQLDLYDRVTLHGFVAEENLEHALSQAHLAFNLRNPTLGEASGSQLRIWDHALCSVVSDAGWYADLPRDCVRHVRYGYEQEDLRCILDELATQPKRLVEAGQRGRQQLLTQHTPQQYVAQLLAQPPSAARNGLQAAWIQRQAQRNTWLPEHIQLSPTAQRMAKLLGDVS